MTTLLVPAPILAKAMDPLTAFGLTCNVIQVIDAGVKAVKLCREIHDHGATKADIRLADTAEKLQTCYNRLDTSLQSKPSNSLTQSEVELQTLSKKCSSTSKELYNELRSLQKSSGGGRRETVSKLARRFTRGKTIKRLQEDLNRYQQVLDTVVLVDVRYDCGDPTDATLR